MHIHPHPKRSNLSLPTWSMLGSLWYILCWYSLFFVYVNWVFIHLWPVFVTLSVCRRVSTHACTLHTHISCTENRNPWAVYFYEDLSVCVSVWEMLCVRNSIISMSWFSTREEAAWKLKMHLREKAPVKAQRSVRAKLEPGFWCNADVGLNAALPCLIQNSPGGSENKLWYKVKLCKKLKLKFLRTQFLSYFHIQKISLLYRCMW